MAAQTRQGEGRFPSPVHGLHGIGFAPPHEGRTNQIRPILVGAQGMIRLRRLASSRHGVAQKHAPQSVAKVLTGGAYP